MAERRMFAKTIIDSDAFLDMPQSAQLLYFHLSMRADDEGFINNPKSIMRNVRCTEEDILQLINKKFIIPFDNGIVVIKHWKIHNYIAKDRFKPTKYKEERETLALDENNSYTSCIQTDIKMETQVRLGKDSIGKNKENIPPSPPKKVKHKYGEYKHVLLTDSEYENLAKSYGYRYRDAAIKFLDEYIEEKGYKSKSHNLAIRRWVMDAVGYKNTGKGGKNGASEESDDIAGQVGTWL